MISLHSGNVNGITLTVTDWTALPVPGPMQVRVYVAEGAMGIKITLPFTGCEPLQSPEAEQEVV